MRVVHGSIVVVSLLLLCIGSGCSKNPQEVDSDSTVERAVVNDGYGDYLLVSSGEFPMGDNFDEGQANELPVHNVMLSSYYIGKYEVTNAEYRKFINDDGYKNESYWRVGGFGEFGEQPLYWDGNTDAHPKSGRRGTDFYKGAHLHGGAIVGNESFPVVGVGWFEAMAYCSWLSAKTDYIYRLPTEAEWEKAARGSFEHNLDNPLLGHQRRFPWGDDLDNSLGNFWNSGDPYDNGTTPVGFYDGSKRVNFQTRNNASPYGAYDMTGNVFEWCLDFSSNNPQDDYQKHATAGTVTDPRGPNTGIRANIRSSDWHHDAFSDVDGYHQVPRAAFRNSEPPHIRGANFGFRCLREK